MYSEISKSAPVTDFFAQYVDMVQKTKKNCRPGCNDIELMKLLKMIAEFNCRAEAVDDPYQASNNGLQNGTPSTMW